MTHITCDCNICQRIRRVRKAMADMTPAQVNMVISLLDDLHEAEMEADVWRCKAMGQWTGWEHNHAPAVRRKK